MSTPSRGGPGGSSRVPGRPHGGRSLCLHLVVPFVSDVSENPEMPLPSGTVGRAKGEEGVTGLCSEHVTSPATTRCTHGSVFLHLLCYDFLGPGLTVAF